MPCVAGLVGSTNPHWGSLWIHGSHAFGVAGTGSLGSWVVTLHRRLILSWALCEGGVNLKSSQEDKDLRFLVPSVRTSLELLVHHVGSCLKTGFN